MNYISYYDDGESKFAYSEVTKSPFIKSFSDFFFSFRARNQTLARDFHALYSVLALFMAFSKE